LFVNGKMVGFSTGIRSTEEGEGRLLNFFSCFVKPEFRRMGLATRMFYRLVGEAKKAGFEGGIVDSARPGMRALIEKEQRKWNAKKDAPISIGIYQYGDDEFEARISSRKREPKKPVLKPHLRP
jgi:GNAT superfamily N-acetyltransferase